MGQNTLQCYSIFWPKVWSGKEKARLAAEETATLISVMRNKTEKTDHNYFHVYLASAFISTKYKFLNDILVSNALSFIWLKNKIGHLRISSNILSKTVILS